jgi:DNA-binding NtrC family response regulator
MARPLPYIQHIMVLQHPQSGDQQAQPPKGRLNLLLSYAGWQDTPWVDRLPMILYPMGIQSHIAASASAAQRVIESNPIHIAVVDLALPLGEDLGNEEEAGTRILNLLARLASPPPTVVIKRKKTAREDTREMNAALRSGAFAVVDRPHAQPEIESLLDVLRRCMNRHYQNRWPGESSS